MPFDLFAQLMTFTVFTVDYADQCKSKKKRHRHSGVSGNVRMLCFNNYISLLTISNILVPHVLEFPASNRPANRGFWRSLPVKTEGFISYHPLKGANLMALNSFSLLTRIAYATRTSFHRLINVGSSLGRCTTSGSNCSPL